MSDEAQNVAILKQAYANWSESKGGNVDEWMSIMADDIRFGSIAQGGHGTPYLTAYRNRDALGEYFGGLLRDWQMVEYSAHEFVAQGDRVVMLGHCTWRYKRNGKVVSTSQSRCLAVRRRQGGRVLRVLRHRPVARSYGVIDEDFHRRCQWSNWPAADAAVAAKRGMTSLA